MSERFAKIFDRIAEMVLCHSPSGSETEIDAYLLAAFEALGIARQQDAVGNITASFPGSGSGRIAITAHKDEIGAIVTAIESDGRVRVRKLGGSFPWVYGEGVVDLLGENRTISGILSFGSRHVSHASPQFAHKENAPLRWADAWIETKLEPTQLEDAGVRIGTRMVVGKHRKTPLRMGDHIASYTLDNKASLAILLEVAQRLEDCVYTVDLVATAKEEVGAVGALYMTQHAQYDAVIALEVAPIAPEYSIVDGTNPVLFAEDSNGLYDLPLNNRLRHIAAGADILLQDAVVSGFGSDGSICMKQGHVPRAACIGFATLNTHGFEIAHLGAIEAIVELLTTACGQELF